MSKDITEDILLRAGFEDSAYSSAIFHLERRDYDIYDIDMEKYQNFNREWYCKVKSFKHGCNCAEADIQTIDHFNKLMELMDIDFRLKEE